MTVPKQETVETDYALRIQTSLINDIPDLIFDKIEIKNPVIMGTSAI